MRRLLIASCALGLCVSGCGSDDDAGTDTASPTATAVTASTAPDPDPTTSTTAPGTAASAPMSTEAVSASTTVEPAPEPPADLRRVLADRGVGSLTLRPVDEGGSHPTLGWEPIDGATSYWLVILDDAGRPYWAWTGSATSVRVGGGDQADGNQTAALHEEMTWSVSAFDAGGELIALSESAAIAP